MPDAYLDGLRVEVRIEMWRSHLERSDARPLLVAVVDGVVVGFAVVGPEARPDGAGARGELYAMNLDPDHWGHGIGRALLRRSSAALAESGYDEAVLWVVPENTRARSLYESEGWRADGAVATEEVLGVTVSEIRYRRVLAGASRAV